MKKLLSLVSLVLLFGVISGFIGCSFKSEATVVSETDVLKALDIIYENTKGRFVESSLYYVQEFLDNQAYKKSKCEVLDTSDVQGKKSTRACIIYGYKEPEKNSPLSNNALVMAQYQKDTNGKYGDLVHLTFFENAKKTDTGISYSTLIYSVVLVNLKTRKISANVINRFLDY